MRCSLFLSLPSHAERPRVLFRRPPVPPPELRPPTRFVRPCLPSRRRPEPTPVPDARRTPPASTTAAATAAVVVVSTPTIIAVSPAWLPPPPEPPTPWFRSPQSRLSPRSFLFRCRSSSTFFGAGQNTGSGVSRRVRFLQLLFFAFSWLRSQAVREVGVGFEEPQFRLMV